MALEGTLKDFALADILQLIGLQKKTGTLYLNDDTDEVTITFKDGMLVFADSKNKRLEGRLGTMLVRSGLVTEGQLVEVLEKQKQTLQRLGVILVNEGIVKQEDLRKALELQVTQIVYRVFRWEDADYRFDQEDQIDYDRENVTPRAADSLLMEGMQMIDEWPIIEKTVRSMQLVFEKVAVDQPVEIEGAPQDDEDDDFDFDLSSSGPSKSGGGESIKLSRDEGAVYELLDGERTLEDAMYLARMSEFATAKAAAELVNRDLIRERTAAVAGEPGTSPAVATPTPAEASPAVVAALHVVLVVLVIGGAAFYRLNPINGQGPLSGLRAADVAAQREVALKSRLERVAYALEVHRLAFEDNSYAQQLEELVDLGYVRSLDLQTPWGQPFDYRLNPEGSRYVLQVLDESGNPVPGMRRVGGQDLSGDGTAEGDGGGARESDAGEDAQPSGASEPGR